MTNWVYDLIILAVLAYFAWRGWRRGLILTLCGLLAIFVAFIGANLATNALAQPMSRLIQPSLETGIHRILVENIGASASQSPTQTLPASDSSAAQALDDLIAQLHLDDVLSAMEDSALLKNFVTSVQEAVHSGMVDVAGNAAHSVANYLALQLARTVLFAVSFCVVLLLWTLVSHSLNLAFKLPGLNLINKSAGGVLGLLKGALIVFILVWLFKGLLFPQEMVEQTAVLKFFCNNSPLSLLTQLMQPKVQTL